jgi:hypothetical protein
MRPTKNLIHQQTAYAAVPVRRSRPHGHKLRPGSVVRIEECAYDAASLIAVHREEPGSSLAIQAVRPLQPFHVGKLRLLCIGRAEGMRSILQRAKAHRFERKCILPRDRLNLDQGELRPSVYPVLASICKAYRSPGISLSSSREEFAGATSPLQLTVRAKALLAPARAVPRRLWRAQIHPAALGARSTPDRPAPPSLRRAQSSTKP